MEAMTSVAVESGGMSYVEGASQPSTSPAAMSGRPMAAGSAKAASMSSGVNPATA